MSPNGWRSLIWLLVVSPVVWLVLAVGAIVLAGGLP